MSPQDCATGDTSPEVPGASNYIDRLLASGRSTDWREDSGGQAGELRVFCKIEVSKHLHSRHVLRSDSILGRVETQRRRQVALIIIVAERWNPDLLSLLAVFVVDWE